jgi:hypothetical protein
MKIYQRLIVSGLCVLSVACTTPPGATPDTPASPEKKTSKSPSAPASIIIVGRSNKAVMEDIVQYRTSKGMKIRSRSANQVEFMAQVNKANIPTEARIQYTLMQVSQGWQLSARVYQISYPSTKKEKVEDITLSVIDKLNEELAGYATN